MFSQSTRASDSDRQGNTAYLSSMVQIPIVALGSGDYEGGILHEVENFELGQLRSKRQRYDDLGHSTVEREL